MALTLSKTGITDGSTIQVGHVTQSVDAFTKAVAYDISLSGSLTLTGSVQSFNGFTGSFTGSHFGTANLSGSFTGSFTGSHFGSANLTGSFTGSLTGDALLLKSSIYLLGNPTAPQNVKMIVGTAKLTAGTVSFPVSELSLNTLGSNCFITATLSGSGASSVSIGGLSGGTLTFNGSGASNDVVYFQAVYF
jgi:hypothetical protein